MSMTVEEVRSALRSSLKYRELIEATDPGLAETFDLTLALLDVYEHGALHTDDDPPCPDPKCKECKARRAVGRALEEMR